jgi:hypothetical protein
MSCLHCYLAASIGNKLDCACQRPPWAVSLCPHYHAVEYGLDKPPVYFKTKPTTQPPSNNNVCLMYSLLHQCIYEIKIRVASATKHLNSQRLELGKNDCTLLSSSSYIYLRRVPADDRRHCSQGRRSWRLSGQRRAGCRSCPWRQCGHGRRRTAPAHQSPTPAVEVSVIR